MDHEQTVEPLLSVDLGKGKVKFAQVAVNHSYISIRLHKIVGEIVGSRKLLLDPAVLHEDIL
jgi:hypothetical protein